MDEEEYKAALAQLRKDWGKLIVDPDNRGILRATNDPMTGILVGMRATVIAEIINRALSTGNERN